MPCFPSSSPLQMTSSGPRHALSNVSFNGPGVEAVFQYLKRDPVLALDERKTRCMAFAYFVAGVHQDVGNAPRERLHPMYRTFKQGVERQDQMQLRREFVEFINDFHATWDNITGGATVCTHTNGTRRPNTAITPEEAVIDVYATRPLIDECPTAPFSVARMSQEFVEGIVMDTMRRWDALTNRRSWAENGDPPGMRSVPLSLLPPSKTSAFSVQGRASGTLQPLIDEYIATRGPSPWSVYAPPPPPPCSPIVFAPPPSVPAPPPVASQPPASAPSQPLAPALSPSPAADAGGSGASEESPRIVRPPSASPSTSRKAEKSRAVRSPSPDVFDDDWNEAMRMHTQESLDYVDKIERLNAQVSTLSILNHSQQLEIDKLKEENVTMITEVTRLRLMHITLPNGEPRTAGVPPLTTPAQRQADHYRPSTPSSSAISSVSSVTPSRTPSRADTVTYEGGVPFRLVANPATGSFTHQRVGVFGEATRRVFAEHEIPNTAHFTLWFIERSYIDEDWENALEHFLGVENKAVVDAVLAAMIEDSTR